MAHRLPSLTLTRHYPTIGIASPSVRLFPLPLPTSTSCLHCVQQSPTNSTSTQLHQPTVVCLISTTKSSKPPTIYWSQSYKLRNACFGTSGTNRQLRRTRHHWHRSLSDHYRTCLLFLAFYFLLLTSLFSRLFFSSHLYSDNHHTT